MLKLSKSKLNTFIQCPERYRLLYSLRMRPLKSAPALIEGQALHHLVEYGLMYRDQVEDVLQVASHGFWEDMPFEACPYETEGEYHAVQARCLAEVESFLDQIGHLDIIHVEHEIDIPLTDPLTGEVSDHIHTRGFIDLVDRSENRPRIIDIKTVGKSPGASNADMALELTLYAYLMAHPDFFAMEEPMPVAFLYLVRTKKPKVIWDHSTRSLTDFAELTRVCSQVAQAIQLGHSWKNPGMHCSWCAYSGFCHNDQEAVTRDFGQDRWEFFMSIQGMEHQIPLINDIPLQQAA